MDYKEIKDFLKSGYNVKSVAKGVVYWKKYLLSKTINTLFTYRPDENIKKMLNGENGACHGKMSIAKRAKELNLDAIHDSVHEMARDEARHGKALVALLDRYFKD